MLDDLKKIHTFDSLDILGKTLKIPASLVRELAEQAGESNQETAQKAVETIRAKVATWSPEIPVAKNRAKQLALECMGRTVVVYAGPEMGHSAYLWRRAMNRIAKVPAWQVNYPTDAQDDLLAWSVDNGVKPHTVVQLRSSFESKKVADTFSVANRLLSGKRPHAHKVEALGQSKLEQLLWASVLGQCVAIYLAIASGHDPSDLTITKRL